ncbi:SMC-Scp complex subunit ScpB [Lacticigenium naphthae]|uniref:SMC-Scp complex subunit ScpB n=1 Tax=Lacticigenium naphthae TaxID=515351 RepID=UPI0003F990BC|nr:SMC-Scp complex subunit ScpB [Lacticigenium naphthae]
MEKNGIGQIEALLFVSGDEGMTSVNLATLLNCSDSEVQAGLIELKRNYEEDERKSITVIETNHRYKLATKTHYSELIKKYAQSPLTVPLSKAAKEILAIVAYKQPITRSEIEEIRGVQCGNTIHKLAIRDLICEHSRMEVPGKPILYATTDYFLDYFNLNALEELPDIQLLEEESENETSLFFESFNQNFETIQEE